MLFCKLFRLIEVVMNSTSGIAATDRVTLLQRMAANPVSRGDIMSLLETRLTDIITTIGSGSAQPVADVMVALSTYLSTQVELDRVIKTKKKGFN
jgi:hypothetical protein